MIARVACTAAVIGVLLYAGLSHAGEITANQKLHEVLDIAKELHYDASLVEVTNWHLATGEIHSGIKGTSRVWAYVFIYGDPKEHIEFTNTSLAFVVVANADGVHVLREGSVGYIPSNKIIPLESWLIDSDVAVSKASELASTYLDEHYLIVDEELRETSCDLIYTTGFEDDVVLSSERLVWIVTFSIYDGQGNITTSPYRVVLDAASGEVIRSGEE